jgi:hypothetical protein
MHTTCAVPRGEQVLFTVEVPGRIIIFASNNNRLRGAVRNGFQAVHGLAVVSD